MKLLEDGYSVRTTVRPDPEKKRDLSFLTNLPGASEKLQIFTADLSDPDSFEAALEGCNVCTILAIVLGNKEEYAHLLNTSMVYKSSYKLQFSLSIKELTESVCKINNSIPTTQRYNMKMFRKNKNWSP
ncbi:hypothetical protein Q3G72_029818 [Acer saccharum]|nr:hypothetical protein Q3G72_029818 [Acer saccharum]